LNHNSVSAEDALMGRRQKKFGFSWSWKRMSGLSAFKGGLSRKLGVPLTRSGRQRKMGRMIGCCVPIALLTVSAAVVVEWFLGL
jgi:hypothetical protein